jgi:GNAT superfamily N-acetyltransferase
MSVTVRPARPEDTPALWRLARELAVYERLESAFLTTEEQLRAQLFEGKWPLLEGLLAETPSGPAGYALFYGRYSSFRAAPILWLEDLYVTDAARSTGAGRALFDAVARIAWERGCARMDWDVLDWNQLAIDFYLRNGAQKVVNDWSTLSLDRAALERIATVGSDRNSR